jgi:hypothetical protein
MKRPRTLLFAVAGLVLACGVVVGILFWPKKSEQPFRLSIVRTGIEQGKPVVFFRVEGDEGRRILIVNVQGLIEDTVQTPFSPGFWSMSGYAGIGNPNKGRDEFGVLAPTNCPV